jgi:ABC-type transport system substrate-binding protein
VKFYDGTLFDASAVATNLDRIMAQNPEALARRLLGPYSTYEILGTYSIRLHLSEPYAPFLDGLSQPYLGIASPAALSAYSVNRYQFHQVGTGPFILEEYVPGRHIVIHRNEGYQWGPAFLRSDVDVDAVDRVTFTFIVSDVERSEAVQNGKAQIGEGIPPSLARSLSANTALRIVPTILPGQPVQLLFNIQRFPTDSLSVRKALIYSSRRNRIADRVYQRFAPIASGAISSTTQLFSRGSLVPYPEDTAKAQELLAAEGFTDGDQNGTLDRNGAELRLKILTPTSDLIPEVAESLVDDWSALGIRVEVVPLPTLTSLVEVIQTGDYNLIAYRQTFADPAFLNDFFTTSGVKNWGNFSNSNLDAVLALARTELNDDARRSSYLQAITFMQEQAWTLPIADATNIYVADARLEGLDLDLFGIPILHGAVYRQLP